MTNHDFQSLRRICCIVHVDNCPRLSGRDREWQIDFDELGTIEKAARWRRTRIHMSLNCIQTLAYERVQRMAPSLLDRQDLEMTIR